MNYFVIWIDRAHAKVFHFSQEKMERKTFKSYSNHHHTHPLDNFDVEKQEKKLFQDVATEISADGQILILGPGVVKHHFQNFLNEHHPFLSKKVLGCETVDHPTDPQIAAYALKFFKIAPPAL